MSKLAPVWKLQVFFRNMFQLNGNPCFIERWSSLVSGRILHIYVSFHFKYEIEYHLFKSSPILRGSLIICLEPLYQITTASFNCSLAPTNQPTIWLFEMQIVLFIYTTTHLTQSFQLSGHDFKMNKSLNPHIKGSKFFLTPFIVVFPLDLRVHIGMTY